MVPTIRVKAPALGVLGVVGYALSVVLANYSITHWGITIGNGPHLIEVLPTVYAPSGVVFVACTLALRNVVQYSLGKQVAIIGITVGAALSFLTSPTLAVASAVAFACSESFDMVVWTTLLKRGIVVAQAVSNLISDIVDSVAFLLMAFGSLHLILGQVVGKEIVTLITVCILMLLRVGRYRTGSLLNSTTT